MPSVSKSEFAILGLLAMGPKSGYDIKQEVQQSLAHFWNESYGNLYPMLRRLLAHGLVERTEVPSDKGPTRLVYSLTADGQSELRDWLRRPIHVSAPRNELLLKLFFGRFAQPNDLIALVTQHRDQLTRMLGRLHQVVTALDQVDPQPADLAYWRLTIGYGLQGIASVTAWCDATIVRLQAMKENA